MRVVATTPEHADVALCHAAGPETKDSCSKALDWDCNGLVGTADPGCQALGFLLAPAIVTRPTKSVRRPSRAPTQRSGA